jgi:hypothetical protein
MITVRFHRTTATYSVQNGLLENFSTEHDGTETLQIAKEHESSGDVGFIGNGYTKQDIYAHEVLIFGIHLFTHLPGTFP